MRILILSGYFPPEMGAASYLMLDLAETLVEQGHAVTVVTGFPRYRITGRPERGLVQKEQMGRVKVIRVASSPFDKGGPFRRGIDHLYVSASLFAGGLAAGRHDVIYFYSPPLTIGLSAWGLSRLWRVPYVAGVQDLFPQYAIDLGLLTNKHLIGAFERLERFVYRTAHGITVNSAGSRDHVINRGAFSERVRVVSNWLDVDFLRPGSTNNTFRQESGLCGKYVVQYAGTMGYQQDLETVIDTAHILQGRGDIYFQLIGDGVQRERLQWRVAQLALTNVMFTPYQPRERLPEVLQSADACLVTLLPDVRTPPIPSKLLGIMASGKPVIVSADARGDAAKTVQQVGCGIIVPPGQPERLAEAVLALKSNADGARAMGSAGRAHAEESFSRQVCARQLAMLFAEAVDRMRRQ